MDNDKTSVAWHQRARFHGTTGHNWAQLGTTGQARPNGSQECVSMSYSSQCTDIVWYSMCIYQYCNNIMMLIRNTIQDGGSTELYAAETVDTFYTVDMVYTGDMVYTVDTDYTVDIFKYFLLPLPSKRYLVFASHIQLVVTIFIASFFLIELQLIIFLCWSRGLRSTRTQIVKILCLKQLNLQKISMKA